MLIFWLNNRVILSSDLYTATFAVIISISLVFNLVNKVDVEETKRKVEAYRKLNEKLIRKNNAKLVSQSSLFIVFILLE